MISILPQVSGALAPEQRMSCDDTPDAQGFIDVLDAEQDRELLPAADALVLVDGAFILLPLPPALSRSVNDQTAGDPPKCAQPLTKPDARQALNVAQAVSVTGFLAPDHAQPTQPAEPTVPLNPPHLDPTDSAAKPTDTSVRSALSPPGNPQAAPPEKAQAITPAQSAWQTRLQILPANTLHPNGAIDLPTADVIATPLMNRPTKPVAQTIETARVSGQPTHLSSSQSLTQQPFDLAIVAPIAGIVADSPPPKQLAQAAPPPADDDQASPPDAQAFVTLAVAPAIIPSHPITAHRPADLPTQPTLPPSIPATLLHHATAAQAGPVDLLLTPEDLGHVRFQIQHRGDSLHVMLSAEHPETLALLRRHADQLQQEFRQAGFAEASLSFGQWGQQHKSSATPAEYEAPSDELVSEPIIARPRPPADVNGSSGRGLNLRL
ncbi:flagellar hook-length control protein FliK [Cypionkella sp.]|uniref:flagellar hook-length control protein FliK n=1 Tax=Cypionkella sp. TaxID=2811411 RepID=UPI00260525FB|nr:flagellar hook-length control protein FliK [Cypionkella sp.]